MNTKKKSLYPKNRKIWEKSPGEHLEDLKQFFADVGLSCACASDLEHDLGGHPESAAYKNAKARYDAWYNMEEALRTCIRKLEKEFIVLENTKSPQQVYKEETRKRVERAKELIQMHGMVEARKRLKEEYFTNHVEDLINTAKR